MPELCKATSKVSGSPCKRFAIPGGTVCYWHGGAAPQVKRSAAMRLAALVSPAIGVLDSAMKQKKDLRVRLNAAQDVLDRNNLSGKQQIDVTSGGQTWADILRARRAKRAGNEGNPTPEQG